MKKFVNDGRIIEVIPFDQYQQLKEGFDTKIAVEWNGSVYPERSRNDVEPGLYNENWGSYLRHPETVEDKERYSINNAIDFDSNKNIRDLLQKSDTLKNVENDLLTSSDKKFTPPLLPSDSPEVRGLKEAVIKKGIDIDLYKDRFGPNYNNDKRFFTKDNITMLKLKSILDNLDMKATLIIEDANDDVPNPIGEKLIIDLMGGVNNDEQS